MIEGLILAAIAGHFYDPHNGHVELKQVDGYCPYVFGLKS